MKRFAIFAFVLTSLVAGLFAGRVFVRGKAAARAGATVAAAASLPLAARPLGGGPVIVNATAGTAFGSYTLLEQAFTAINNGTHQGAITISLVDASVTVATSAVLNASGTGSASYTSVSLQPQGGPVTVSGSIAGPLIDLNGADNVTIDGLNTGGQSLALRNTLAGSASATIRFINGATNNLVQNATLESGSTNTSGGTVFFSTDGSTANGNDNNQITACNIGPAGASLPVNAIYSSGSTATTALNNSGNTISNCNLYDFYSAAGDTYGLRLAAGSTDWTISGNSFYWTAARAGVGNSMARAISLETGNNHAVTGNFIGGSAPNAGGSPWTINTPTATYRFTGIRLTVGTTAASSVQNNTLANFVWRSSSSSSNPPGVWGGIYVSAGNVNIGTVTGNTIGSGTGTGSVAVSTEAHAYTYGISSDSTGTVAVSNNTIGSITTASITASGTASTTFRHGISVIEMNAGTNTVTNNLVGSLSTANSINASSATNTSQGQGVWGIRASSTGTNVISNNTVANLNNNYTGADASFSQVTAGIFTNAGVNTISGNTVRNLSTTAQIAAAGVVGILQVANSAAGQTVTQNVVHSLTNTTASGVGVQIHGIYYSGPATGTNLVARNFVHSLAPAAGNATMILRGINTNGGVTTYQNNLVRLGVKADGSSITTGNLIVGIYEESGTNSYYHNTVFIGGTGVTPSNFTYALYITLAGQTRGIRNNIFFNGRDGCCLSNVAARYLANPPTPSGLSLSNNLYGSPNGILLYNGSNPATLQAWQRLENQDANSAIATLSQLNFVNAAGNASTVDLHLQSPTAAEGAGVNVASVTDDFDGQTRGTLTPVDIGADALNATGVDVFPPVIAFTPLGNIGPAATRTLTATITDTTGVPTAGALAPRIYYRKNTGAFFSQPGTLTAGTATNGTWDFTINYADVGGIAGGNLISYYVIAQDTAANLNSQVLGVEASNVNTVTTHPTLLKATASVSSARSMWARGRPTLRSIALAVCSRSSTTAACRPTRPLTSRRICWLKTARSR